MDEPEYLCSKEADTSMRSRSQLLFGSVLSRETIRCSTSSFWTLSYVPQYYKYVDGETFRAGGNEQGEYVFVKGTILVLHSAESQGLRRSRGQKKRSVA